MDEAAVLPVIDKVHQAAADAGRARSAHGDRRRDRRVRRERAWDRGTPAIILGLESGVEHVRVLLTDPLWSLLPRVEHGGSGTNE